MALLRAATTNEAAAERMQAIFATPDGAADRALTGEPRAAAAARAGLIATQILGLALCRYVLRLPPVVGAQAPRHRAARRCDGAVVPVRRLSTPPRH